MPSTKLKTDDSLSYEEQVLIDGSFRFLFSFSLLKGFTLLIENDQFQESFFSILNGQEEAFFLEFPGCTKNTSEEKPFEFILIPKRYSNHIDDSSPFKDHFKQSINILENEDSSIIIFPSGKKDEKFGNFLKFIRHSPKEQFKNFIKEIGTQILKIFNTQSQKPVWVTTGSVSLNWAHIRIDFTPKFITYQPFEKYETLIPKSLSQKNSKLKKVVFIRHGQSIAQTAFDRYDPELHDCDLSSHGYQQAIQVSKSNKKFRDAGKVPDVIFSSPLTRAIKTALLAHPDDKIVVHPGFAEFDSSSPIPENRGRSIELLLADKHLKELGIDSRVDLSHAVSLNWPNMKKNIDGIDFLRDRPEEKIVIFTHYNYTLSVLRNTWIHAVHNCRPIHVLIDFSKEHPQVYLDQPHDFYCS